MTNEAKIISTTTDSGTTCVAATCGKKEAFLTFNAKRGDVSVLCINAAHRAYRASLGRVFRNVDEALAAYKSETMRTMIRAGYAEACAVLMG